MVPFRNIRMDLMSSKEVAAYLKKKQTVLLPVGCFEMHGPLVPLACDSFLDWGGALLMGEKWNILVMPPIYYTYPGASGPWPGTVDISPEITVAYVKEIVKALLKNGFRQVILCGSHGPLGFLLQEVIRSVFQETGQVVLHISPWRLLLAQDLAEKEFGRPITEDLFVLAMMKVLGLHGAFDPKAKVERKTEFSHPTISELKKFGGTVPWYFNRDYQHTGLRKDISIADADRAVAVIKKALDRAGDLPKVFAKYQKAVAEDLKKRPWKKASIWTM